MTSLSNVVWTSSCPFLGSWASVYGNVRRKLCVGKEARVGGVGRMDWLASIPAQGKDMASSCFLTLLVYVQVMNL